LAGPILLRGRFFAFQRRPRAAAGSALAHAFEALAAGHGESRIAAIGRHPKPSTQADTVGRAKS